MDMHLLLDSMWIKVPALDDRLLGCTAQLGIIAKRSDGDESWKAYCGVVIHYPDNIDMAQERKDIESIVANGQQLQEVQARALFPIIQLAYRK